MSQGKGSALRLTGVGKRFGDMAALSDISLSVDAGEIVSLVGRSGCGKSTLLRLISGVDLPDHGSIELNGFEVSGPAGFVEPEDRNVGFMFQDYALFPHLTVSQNIAFGLKKLPKAEAAERVATVIGNIGLEPLAQRYPHTLSGGEQQRVALARALAPRPALLLMDEPYSNLDRGLRETVREQTTQLLRAMGTTVIMVTHDPEEALATADRIVLMRAGRVVQVGDADDLYDRPRSRYAAEFFSIFNRLPGTVKPQGLETGLGLLPIRSALPEGTAVTVYIRPTAITLGQVGLPARVMSRSLMGEIEQLVVDVAGLEEPLRIRSTKRSSLVPGSTTNLIIDNTSVLHFAADRALI